MMLLTLLLMLLLMALLLILLLKALVLRDLSFRRDSARTGLTGGEGTLIPLSLAGVDVTLAGAGLLKAPVAWPDP